MHVISEKKLRAFWTLHPDSGGPLRTWIRVAEKAEWRTFADVRAVFPHADLVGDRTIFNIGGNKYRLIAVVHFNRGKVYVRHILTHADYDRGQWKEPPSPRGLPKKKPKDKPG